MNLILINGTMGAGKTATSMILKEELPNAVFLDGDWCWDMSPFIVNEKRKNMVMNNIHFLLNSFISSKEYENIIFCWVMHEQSIMNDVLAGLNADDLTVHKFTLFCNEQALRERILLDVKNGVRDEDVIERSVERIPLYLSMDTQKIDVSEISAKQAAEMICNRIYI